MKTKEQGKKGKVDTQRGRREKRKRREDEEKE